MTSPKTVQHLRRQVVGHYSEAPPKLHQKGQKQSRKTKHTQTGTKKPNFNSQERPPDEAFSPEVLLSEPITGIKEQTNQ